MGKVDEVWRQKDKDIEGFLECIMLGGGHGLKTMA